MLITHIKGVSCIKYIIVRLVQVTWHVVKHGVESGVYFGVESGVTFGVNFGVNFGVFFFKFFSKMHVVSFTKIVIIIFCLLKVLFDGLATLKYMAAFK